MTPDFPSLAGGFADHLHRLRTTVGPALHQFEVLFHTFLPRWLLAQQDEEAHSRDRRWNLRLTFWTFLWQVAQAGASCREAIRQAKALCLISGRPPPADQASSYCQARGALPTERLERIHHHLVTEAEAATAAKDLWCGHRVIVTDGSTVTAPDTPENQVAFPQQSVQRRGCGFPIIRIVCVLTIRFPH